MVGEVAEAEVSWGTSGAPTWRAGEVAVPWAGVEGDADQVRD